jgi:transposase
VAALASRDGGGYRCRLSAGQLARLAAELEAGPAAQGWADQRWTLARAAALIGRLFGVRYSLRGTSLLLHRMGYSPQRPVHRAAERDEGAIAAWRATTWAKVRLAAAGGAWICFEDETGQTLHPPKARTWARRGHPPVVKVCGKGSERVSVAGLVCVKPGHAGHLFTVVRVHRRRKGERRSLSEADYAALLTAAHHHLRAPLIVIWDNLNTHRTHQMRVLITRRPWLKVARLPAYAPELNAAEGAWAVLKNGLGNLAVFDIGDLAAIIKTRLRSIQHRPSLIEGFLAQTGLTLEPEPP